MQEELYILFLFIILIFFFARKKERGIRFCVELNHNKIINVLTFNIIVKLRIKTAPNFDQKIDFISFFW